MKRRRRELRVDLFCPSCRERHVDRGPWARRVHRTHLCLFCGTTWRVVPYVFGRPIPKGFQAPTRGPTS